MIVLVVLLHVFYTAPSRGPVIRVALITAAAKTKSLPATQASDSVRDAIAVYFRNFDADIDASRFPAEVDVALHNLDGVTCLEARDEARRIEGLAVVELEGFGTAAACGYRNTMTWRLLP